MKPRVFVFECPERICPHIRERILFEWERETKGTEIEGAVLLVLGSGCKLSELTGEGLEKLTIEDGRIVPPKESNS